jgi:diaminohydroxyphosphoribosylaminopyrimidine deaminase/5-amino-6-(5-phosphoribosylamino)uracil reductase
MVGCVIVHDNKIVSEGYHEMYGGAHAEVNAIHLLPNDIQPEKCTLYVNLEPCSHFGKTPPCSDLIIRKGFKKVVIGHVDPNPLVSGNGIKVLKENGIEVTIGILEKECQHLNRRFNYYHKFQKPWITLKWAQTSDGFISRKHFQKHEENKITGREADIFVHELRSMHQAILVGKNTVLNDNPLLNVRYFNGRNPKRIVLGFDENMKDMNINKKEFGETIFLTLKSPADNMINCLEVNTHNPFELEEVFKKLNLQSILVEGGRKIHDFFLKNRFYNEVICLSSTDKLFHEGIPAPKFPAEFSGFEEFILGRDVCKIITFY